MYSNKQFVYSRERRRFGRQCLFSDRNQLMLSINPSRRQRLNYILGNPVDQGTQMSDQKAYSIIETENVGINEHGMYHTEGGWPKEVNIHDEESTQRHRKKIERDDNWGTQVLDLIERSINVSEQNNTVNIYQDFFQDLSSNLCENLKAEFEARQNDIFHDPIINANRPISVIDWLPNDITKLMVLHTNIPLFREIPLTNIKQEKDDVKKVSIQTPSIKAVKSTNALNDFYIWGLENPLQPIVTFRCATDKVLKAFVCPKDENWIAGGLQSGKICLWNSRNGDLAVNTCPLEASHREEVSALCWVHSKTNSEFFSGSYDGSVKYWDGRDLNAPSQEILLDTELTDDQSRDRAHGVTVLQFEYTIPIRFIIGSDMGSVFIGNRKAATPTETLTAGNYRLFCGPIRTIERNPFFVKNFLITGDWCAKIWAELWKGSPTTLLVKKKNQILCGTWSTTRCSLFVTGDSNGELDFWDLLLHHRKPIFSMKFSSRILNVKFRSDGEYLAVGLGNGDLQMLELDSALKYGTSKDKSLVLAIFEREQLRCKLLERRVEEIKLKQQLKALELEKEAQLNSEKIKEELLDPENPEEFIGIISADSEFMDVLNGFQDQVIKVHQKRQEQVRAMDKTEFELDVFVEEENQDPLMS